MMYAYHRLSYLVKSAVVGNWKVSKSNLLAKRVIFFTDFCLEHLSVKVNDTFTDFCSRFTRRYFGGLFSVILRRSCVEAENLF